MSGFSFLRLLRGRVSRGQHSLTQRYRAKPAVEVLEDRQLLSSLPLGGLGFFLASNRAIFDPAPAPIASTIQHSTTVNTTVLHATAGNAQAQPQAAVNPTVTIAPATPAKQAAIVDGAPDPSTPASGNTVNQSASNGTATQAVNVNFGSATTDWTQSKGLAQFDPSLGTLTGVEITNSGTLTSRIRVESLDSAPASVTGTVSGNLRLTSAVLSSPIVTTTKAETESFHAAAYDGQNDFGGTSGQDFGNKSSGGSQTRAFTSPTDLAKFIGVGQVSLTETAHATSSAAGAGNLLTRINSTAQANVTVVYHYIPAPVTVTGIPDNPPGGSPAIPLTKRMFLASTFRLGR